jgi:hypothetical protein
MICCCNNIEAQSMKISDIANIVIACANVALAFYVFIYQKRKDKESALKQKAKEQADKITVLDIQEQNIRLLWFKELIVQPHLSSINQFYKNLHSIEEKLNHTVLTEEIKEEVSSFVKNECSILRKSFIDILRTVNPEIHKEIKENIDFLLDIIIEKLFDVGLNLNNHPTFEREVGSKISYSYNDLIGKLYSYKGN